MGETQATRNRSSESRTSGDTAARQAVLTTSPLFVCWFEVFGDGLSGLAQLPMMETRLNGAFSS